MKKRILGVWLFALAGLLLAACGGGSSGDNNEGGKRCVSDADCMNTSSNMHCNVAEQLCVDRGLCTNDAWCFGLYGDSLPFCEDGLCVPDDGTHDGDTATDDQTDTDNTESTDTDVFDGDGTQSTDTQVDGDDTPSTDPQVDGDDDREYVDIPESSFDTSTELVDCSHDGSITTPTLTANPTSLDFGAVQITSTSMLTSKLCNSGGVDVHISSLRFMPGTSSDFQKVNPTMPLTLPPGKAAVVYVIYYASDNVADSGTIEVLSDASATKQIKIPLMSSIKAAPVLTFDPETVQFAGALAGQTVSKSLKITNVGNAGTVIYSLAMESGTTSHYRVLEVSSSTGSTETTGPWPIPAAGYMNVVLAMTGAATNPDDNLLIGWSSAYGDIQSKVKLTAGSQPICAKANAGPDQQVDPLATVTLDGSQSHDDNGTIQGYQWTFVSKPDGASRAVLLNSAGVGIEGQWTMEMHPKFFAELAGDYVVQLNVKDSETACANRNIDSVKITAVPASVIHVQLMWSQASDQDLHLIEPGGTIYNRTTDCFYGNCATQNGTNHQCPARGCPGPAGAPDWGTTGVRYDDPTLDIDDTTSTGPENINLSAPVVGSYTVGVLNYANGPTTNQATVRIWIFGTLTNTFVFDTVPYPSVKDWWKVCTIDVADATHITVTPVNTVESGRKYNLPPKKKAE